MGFTVTAATFTCDKCGTTLDVDSATLPADWTQVRRDNGMAILCPTCTTALNSFFEASPNG